MGRYEPLEVGRDFPQTPGAVPKNPSIKGSEKVNFWKGRKSEVPGHFFLGGGNLGRLVKYYIFWSNYSDLTRPHPKWWFRKGIPLISGSQVLGLSVVDCLLFDLNFHPF